MGKTKRGEGQMLMVIVDAHGLPLAVHEASASPHEITLVEATVADSVTMGRIRRLIGDRAYNSDPHAEKLKAQGIELIAPHREGRKKPATQDGRILQQYKRRWKVERFFAWLNRFKRVTSCWDRCADCYTAFMHLACAMILSRKYLRNEF